MKLLLSDRIEHINPGVDRYRKPSARTSDKLWRRQDRGQLQILVSCDSSSHAKRNVERVVCGGDVPTYGWYTVPEVRKMRTNAKRRGDVGTANWLTHLLYRAGVACSRRESKRRAFRNNLITT